MYTTCGFSTELIRNLSIWFMESRNYVNWFENRGRITHYGTVWEQESDHFLVLFLCSSPFYFRTPVFQHWASLLYCYCYICGHNIALQWRIMRTMVSQITGASIACSAVCSGADQRKHQNSAPLAFVRGIHRWPADSPHKGPVTRKMFPFYDVILVNQPLQMYRFLCTIVVVFAVVIS